LDSSQFLGQGKLVCAVFSTLTSSEAKDLRAAVDVGIPSKTRALAIFSTAYITTQGTASEQLCMKTARHPQAPLAQQT